jgi:hypothetical protein
MLLLLPVFYISLRRHQQSSAPPLQALLPLPPLLPAAL